MRRHRSSIVEAFLPKEYEELLEKGLSKSANGGSKSSKKWIPRLPHVKTHMSRPTPTPKKSQGAHRGGSTGTSLGTRNFQRCPESAPLGAIVTLQSSGCRNRSYCRPVKKAPHLPECPADGPRNGHISIDLRKVCGVGDLGDDTFHDANVAIEGPIKTPAMVYY